MKAVMFTLAALVSTNVAMAKSGVDCRINVYTPDADRAEEVPTANAINEILTQKGYTVVFDNSGKLTHSSHAVGFGTGGCSLNKWSMKMVRAMAQIEGDNYELFDRQFSTSEETATACADLGQAMIEATKKLKSCSEL